MTSRTEAEKLAAAHGRYDFHDLKRSGGFGFTSNPDIKKYHTWTERLSSPGGRRGSLQVDDCAPEGSKNRLATKPVSNGQNAGRQRVEEFIRKGGEESGFRSADRNRLFGGSQRFHRRYR